MSADEFSCSLYVFLVAAKLTGKGHFQICYKASEREEYLVSSSKSIMSWMSDADLHAISMHLKQTDSFNS